MRVFLSLDVEDEIKKEIAVQLKPVQESFPREVRWTRRSQWHLTLLFFRDLPKSALASFQENLTPLFNESAFDAAFEQVGIFPERPPHRVLFLRAVPEAPFQKLAAAARAAAQGSPYDPKPFIPHLTLARARSDRRVLKACYRALSSFSSVKGHFSALTLYQSERKSKGVVHTPLAHYSLRETDAQPPQIH